ncbi:MAG: adenylyltransferase/cytidyltransferase family protein [Bacteroidota bacterium]
MSRLSFIQDKIVSLETAVKRAELWKMKNNKVVFTNGCFDILHHGHVTYLAKAAEMGDKLIVALNTDASVKLLGKDINRPINNEQARLHVLASLAFVDLVILFSNETPLEEITQISPQILVKGADYDPEMRDSSNKKYIVGSDFVLKNGGEVKVVELEAGFSTSSIIEKIKK